MSIDIALSFNLFILYDHMGPRDQLLYLIMSNRTGYTSQEFSVLEIPPLLNLHPRRHKADSIKETPVSGHVTGKSSCLVRKVSNGGNPLA